MPLDRILHEENRLSWNAATDAHNSHKRDQAGFLRNGGSTLFPEERDLLGNIAGKELIHLQCNAGQDTLSLAALGAKVTGVDISDSAIAFATRLSEESGLPGAFVRADVYDWLNEAAASGLKVDVVFSSYGAIPWLSDLDTWARGIAAILKPGGRFVLVEFHPYPFVFNENWEHHYPYFSGGRAATWVEGIGDYVAAAGAALAPSGYDAGVESFANPHPVHEFNWGLGEIVSALTINGLRLEVLREYPYSNGAKLFNDMVEGEGHRMYPPAGKPALPLMFGLAATR